MIHDPLCPANSLVGWLAGECQCALIHKVRQDERIQGRESDA